MKHTLTPNAIGSMLAGLYMVIQFSYFGCRALQSVGTVDDLKAISKPAKLTIGMEWLVVLIGINLLAVASPYADWSVLALAVSSVGIIMLLVSFIAMMYHLEGSPDVFPVKTFTIDMVFFLGGMAITWVSSWL